MNLLNKIELIKETLNDYFKDRHEILFAYIFGSTVTGTANKLSDIDIAIFINEKKINEKDYRYGYQAEILTDLMKILKTDKVDLVILNYATTLLKHRVIYFGKLIYSIDEEERVKFQVNTINKYMDYKMLKRKIS
ncbi:MAG: nucleotidyltransferase domain-containing protein [Actinobacteria bacterium]|nr:nucleotidyltransferase domain-containing protein [Actinomycetota bacterium]